MEIVPLVPTEEKVVEREWDEFSDMVFDISKPVMELSEFLAEFRKHLPGVSDRLSLRKDNMIDMYDQVFRKRLVMYSKMTKLPTGEPIWTMIFEADIKLWQDFSLQVIEPILRRDLHASINHNLEELYKVTRKVDDQQNLSTYSSLASAGDTGEALRKAILTIMKAMNSIYMIEVYTVEFSKAPREASLSRWVRKSTAKSTDTPQAFQCDKIIAQFLKALIDKYFENYQLEFLAKNALKNAVPKIWTKTDPVDSLIWFFFNELIHDALFAQVGGFWLRLINKTVLNFGKYAQFATVLAATNPDFDNRIPEVLRKVSEGIRKVLVHLPNTVQPQLDLCSESLLNIVELIKHGKWEHCEKGYKKFRKELSTSEEPLKVWTEFFKLRVVSKPNTEDPEWTHLEFKNPVPSKGILQNVESSRLY